MSVPDLWPSLKPHGELTPLGILRKQAALLFRKTNGLLEGQVKTDGTGPEFVHNFNIIAPALGHFTYQMFSISHGLHSYPLTSTNRNGRTVIQTESELLTWIRNEMETQRPTIEQLLNESLPDSERAELVG